MRALGQVVSQQRVIRDKATACLCRAHYHRWRRHGDPLRGGSRRAEAGAPVKFFREKVLTYDDDDCLIWPFGCSDKGCALMSSPARSVSRLVCQFENGPPPTVDHQAAHSCGRGHEGCVTKRHLRWATPVENQADRLGHGTSPRGEQCGTAKLTVADVHLIRALEGTASQREIGLKFAVNDRTISSILQGKSWAWLPRI